MLDIARGKSGHSSALLSVNLLFKFLEYTIREIKPMHRFDFIPALCAQVDFFFILTVPKLIGDVILLKCIVIVTSELRLINSFQNYHSWRFHDIVFFICEHVCKLD